MLDKDKMTFTFFMKNIEEKIKKDKKKKITVALDREYWIHILNAYKMLIEEGDRFQQIRVLANKLRVLESNQMDYDKWLTQEENKE